MPVITVRKSAEFMLFQTSAMNCDDDAFWRLQKKRWKEKTSELSLFIAARNASMTMAGKV